MGVTAGVIFGILSMLAFGLGNALSKVPAQKLGGRNSVLFRNLMMSVFLFMIFIFFERNPIISFEYILIAIGVSVIGYLPLFTLYKALDVGKVGVVTPITGSSIFFTVVLSIVFFGERVGVLQGFAIAAIIIGVVLISINFREFRKSHIFDIKSGVPFALVTCLGWGVYAFLFNVPVNVLGPIMTGLITETGILVIGFFAVLFSKEGFRVPDIKTMNYVIMVAFFGVAAVLAYGAGLNSSDVSIVAPIAFANPIVATLYGAVFYGERLKFQQYSGVVLAIMGIVFMSL